MTAQVSKNEKNVASVEMQIQTNNRTLWVFIPIYGNHTDLGARKDRIDSVPDRE